MTINSVFDKVYVLTIQRNHDRHPLVEKYLEGIQFEFWYGLDASTVYPEKKYVLELPDDFFKIHTADKEHVSWWTKGQLGAYISIKNMIEHVAKSDYKQVLIFEDDLIPTTNNWQKILLSGVEQLPSDWDVLLAGYIYRGELYEKAYHRKYRGLIKTWNYFKYILGKENIKVLPKKYSKNLDQSGICTGGHAYCLSKKGAEFLMKYLNPMKEGGDILVNRLIAEKKINSYSVYPCLFLQNNLFSSKTTVI